MRSKIFILILLTISIIKAQKYNFITYDVKDGLALTQISDIETYSDGRLIIGTYGGGLNIYDGQDFETIDISSGLANNAVYSLAIRHDHQLWVGTEKGLSQISGNGIVTFDQKNGLPSNFIWSLAFGSDSTLWIGTNYGLAKYDNGVFKIINDELVSEKEIISLFADSKGDMWIGTANDLIKYESKIDKYTTESRFGDIASVNSICEDQNGIIFVGTDQGLYKIHNKEIEYVTTKNGLISNLVWSLFVDQNNDLWIGTDKGAVLYKNDKFIKIAADEGLCDYHVWEINKDLEGNLWFGTDHSLYKLTDISFKIFQDTKGKPIDAWSIVEAGPDEYIISSELRGLVRLKNGKFQDIKTGSLEVSGSSTLFIDNDRKYWLAFDKGIYRFTNKFFNVNDLYYDTHGPVPFIMQQNGDIYFSTYYHGTVKYDGKEFSSSKITPREAPMIFYNHLDSQGRLWAATGSGIQIVTDDSIFVPKEFEDLKDYTFMNMIEDSYGNVYAGSYEKGLFVFDSENITSGIDSITEEHGLNNNSILATVFDSDSNLWISTNEGINRFDLEEYHQTGQKKILSYNSNDGIIGSEGIQNGILFDSKGNIIVSTTEGLVFFDPQKIAVNERKPAVKIKRIKIVDRDFNEIFLDRESLGQLSQKTLELPYDRNNFTIEFVGISLTNPTKVHYSYKLGSSDWSKPSTVPLGLSA